MNAKQFLAGLVELANNGEWEGRSLDDLAREFFNCSDAEVDSGGDLWIATPQVGHWVNDERLLRFATFVCRECKISAADALTL